MRFRRGRKSGPRRSTVFAGTDKTIALAKKYKLKTAWGTDILFSQRLAQRQGELLVKFTRWYTPAETLVMATGTNAELLAMSGKRNPYPGKLGVVEEGALADLLLVDGDPIADIKLIAGPGKKLRRHHEGRQDLQEHFIDGAILNARLCRLAENPRLITRPVSSPHPAPLKGSISRRPVSRAGCRSGTRAATYGATI